MILSKRIFAVMVVLFIVICMIGYLSFIPKIFEEFGIIKTTDAEELNNNVSTDIKNTKLSALNKIIDIRTKTENKFNDILLKYQFIEINGGFNSILDKKMIIDSDITWSSYKLKNNYLTQIKTISDNEIPKYAQKLIELNSLLKSKNIDLLFVQAPHKNNKYDDFLPKGVTDYYNDDADLFLSSLNENDIDYLDLREAFIEKDLNWYEMFFKTDHHWNAVGGLNAAIITGEYLKRNYNFEIEDYILDLKSYNFDKFDEPFLGTYGRRTGQLYGGVDDIDLIIPEFDTNLSFEYPEKNITRTGDFYNTIFNFSILKNDLYTSERYAVYTGGNLPLTILKNYNGNGKRILMISDSYENVFAPYALMYSSEIYSVDLRGFDKPLNNFIDEVNPDIVIFLYNCSLLKSEMFNFNGE